jgi:hypothetical protein
VGGEEDGTGVDGGKKYWCSSNSTCREVKKFFVLGSKHLYAFCVKE